MNFDYCRMLGEWNRLGFVTSFSECCCWPVMRFPCRTTSTASFCPAPVQPRTANDLQALLPCHVCSISHEHSRGFGLSSNRFDNRAGSEDVTHCASSSATLESPRHCSYRWSAEHALRNCDCSLPICPLDRRLVEPHIRCDRRSCSYRYTGRSGRASHGW